MAYARRFLPSIFLLCTFEAAARHQNFTAAALKQHLTQSVISRQIRLQEEQLGARLFARERQTVRLTVAGEAYAHEIREACDRHAGPSGRS
ncbi:regulatory helix-turn-helix LysR family protein [Acetobacter aceti NBRC 14818]|uniref:HTH lysR-type domain-containing protein n=1 Tax=Acetobacter aceti NBRC 14818 TaxID=887700 RepID=A0AB33IG49_ACEAC|nr:LysR family transcriptional regulator [Acetobacter aceti]TCS34440.1 regulatory helix-turn-helix LysR family protein [Acetobacter aceti NBRC 14818]BCK76866.1 hypothetical protein EMQ_2472 [Acetobacter aceti NBRC 14818]GAN56306.1 transcriptional regulator LysR [Acetobacter aceti NBRC 14818]